MIRRIFTVFLVAVMIAPLGIGCATSPSVLVGEGIRFTDAEGRTVCVPHTPDRVVALQGSFAETWLLAGGSLVGVTEDAISELHLSVDGAEIVGSVKTPDSERILSLQPDFVILSSDIAGHRDIAGLLDASGIVYAYAKQETPEEYLALLSIYTELTGCAERYAVYGTAVEAEVERVREQAAALTGEPLRVLFVRARSQGVAAKARDHMVCTMLEDFGCINLAGVVPSMLENLSIEQIIAQDPDVILVSVMGEEGAARAYLEAEWESNPAFSDLTAVKNGRYFFLPKRLYHYKPNAAWGEAYEILYEMLYTA